MNIIKIALIDHNDSFTYNVVELLRKVGNNTITVINYENLTLIKLQKFDKIILSPGPGLPKNYPLTFDIISQYYKTKPILGICLGHQAICSYFGSDLYNSSEVVHGVSKKINVLDHSFLFKNIPNITEVGLYHSWAVSNNTFSTELSITAKSKTGIIMAVKHTVYPIFGIQFHPESFLSSHGEIILENFITI